MTSICSYATPLQLTQITMRTGAFGFGTLPARYPSARVLISTALADRGHEQSPLIGLGVAQATRDSRELLYPSRNSSNTP